MDRGSLAFGGPLTLRNPAGRSRGRPRDVGAPLIPAHERARVDVAIVGAGPAGSIAALQLARAGRRVVLVDGRTFPRDKVCGDLVGTDAVRALTALGLGHVLDGAQALRAAYVHAPSGRTAGGVVAPDERSGLARVMPRSAFDARLRAAASSAGAHTVTAQVRGLVYASDGRVAGLRTATEDITAPLVIGADGYGSCIARSIGSRAQTRDDTAIVVRAYADGVPPWDQAMHFYINSAEDGYGWVFPLGGGRANVGLGFIASERTGSRPALQAAFERFTGAASPAAGFLRGATLAHAATWPIPFGPASAVASEAGVFLAGDAARLASPLSGSGIHHAIRSGALAAACADRALAGDSGAYARYRAAVRRRFDARTQIERRVHRVAGTPVRVEPWLTAAAFPGAGGVFARALLALG